jgi:rhombotail lipoprotein
MIPRFFIVILAVLFCSAALFGCVQSVTRSSSSAPLTEVIDTIKDSQQAVKKTPLALPAAVVVMFVPGKDRARDGSHVPNTTLRQAAEKLKQQLLENPKYIKSVTVVSGDYIKARISLAQIKAIYASDIVIILSYEQDQRSYQSGVAGLLDFTIVGMFLVPGVETKTTTVIDGKVIHIPSDAMIFRSNGMDERSVHSTSYGSTSTATEESINSILAATTEFGKSLSKVLTKFDNYDISEAVSMSVLTADNSLDTVKGKPSNDYWAKVDTYKSTGGGAFGVIPLLISLVVCWAARRRT